MLFWGLGWTALKILTILPMDIIIFWRFFIMTLAFIPILYYIKIPIQINRSSFKYILSSSALNISFMISSYIGVKYGLAGSGSVIITTFSPVITIILMVLLFTKRLNTLQYIGMSIGIVGGAIMLQFNDLNLFFNTSNIYFLACAVIWAGVTILSQHSQKHIHPIHYSFIISVISTVASFMYAYNSKLLIVFDQNLEFWIALVYLGVLAQAVATTIYFIASGKLGSEKTSSFMFLVPVFGLLSAYFILDEPIELHILVGGTISIIAVILINKKRKTL